MSMVAILPPRLMVIVEALELADGLLLVEATSGSSLGFFLKNSKGMLPNSGSVPSAKKINKINQCCCSVTEPTNAKVFVKQNPLRLRY